MPKRLVTEYGARAGAEKDWTIPWELLRTGEVEQALSMLREGFEQLPNSFNALALGMGYMWAGTYERAAEHFSSAAHSKRTPPEDLFGFAGAAKWCLKDFGAAIGLWQEGLHAPYATGGVCSKTPMLLFTASVLRPDSFPKGDAEGLIANTSMRVRYKFQAALGQFLLGQIKKQEMEPLWVGKIARGVWGVLPEHKWRTGFYENVLFVSRNELDMDSFRSRMRFITDTSTPEWKDVETFAGILQTPEFFIARCEASQWSHE